MCLCAIVDLMVYAIFFKKETFEITPYPIPDSEIVKLNIKMSDKS